MWFTKWKYSRLEHIISNHVPYYIFEFSTTFQQLQRHNEHFYNNTAWPAHRICHYKIYFIGKPIWMQEELFHKLVWEFLLQLCLYCNVERKQSVKLVQTTIGMRNKVVDNLFFLFYLWTISSMYFTVGLKYMIHYQNSYAGTAYRNTTYATSRYC